MTPEHQEFLDRMPEMRMSIDSALSSPHPPSRVFADLSETFDVVFANLSTALEVIRALQDEVAILHNDTSEKS